MTLQDFLSLIEDEEVRIELEIDWDGDAGTEYQYHHFWLSDFRSSDDIAKYYRDYNVSSFSLMPEQEKDTQIRIQIKSLNYGHYRRLCFT